MKNRNEEFLSLYRELESTIRNAGYDYKTHEDSLSDDALAARYRICRVMRNYLSHQNDNAFIAVTDEQIEFVKEQIKHFKMQGEVVKKHLGTLNAHACKLGDKCADVLERMARRKLEEMPVYSEVRGKPVFGVVSIYDVSALLVQSKANRISDVKNLGKNYDFAEPSDDMSNLKKGVHYFCKDGDKVLGYVVR